MRSIAIEITRELSKKEGIIGILTFGSVATGKVHAESDVDIAVIMDDKLYTPGREIRLVKNIKVEIWTYPASNFVNSLEKLSQKDAWMWSGLWIDMMRSSLILFDPESKLAAWKNIALNWRWRISNIMEALERSKSNIETASLNSSINDILNSLLALRDAYVCLAAAVLMIENEAPSIRPKDLYPKLKNLKKHLNGLIWSFKWINDLEVVRENLLKNLLDELLSWLNNEWGDEERGARSEYKNAIKSFLNEDLETALLSARYSAYWLGFRTLRNRGLKLKVKLYNANNHLTMIRELRSRAHKYHEFYKRIHILKPWSLKQLKKAIQNAEKFIDELKTQMKELSTK